MHHHLVELSLGKLLLVSHLRLLLNILSLRVHLCHLRRSLLLRAVSRLSSLSHGILVKILLLSHYSWVFIVRVLV